MRMLPILSVAFAALAASGAASAQPPGIRAVDQAAHEEATRRLPSMLAAGCPHTKVNVIIPSGTTGTGFAEHVSIMEPCGYSPVGPDLPLVVAWNGYGQSASNFFTSAAGLVAEANERGWLLVAVTGVDDKTMGCAGETVPYPTMPPPPADMGVAIPAQRNVMAAIDYMIANYPVDEDRIYALGWSAGGGAAASFSARHLDPTRPMIAALATNAGSYDLIHTYNSETDPTFLSDTRVIFGGVPTNPLATFNYVRSESEYLTPGAASVYEFLSQMRNLRNIPIRHVYSSDDPLTHIVTQNVRFAAFLSGAGYDISTTVFTGLPTLDKHSWLLLDPVTTFDFFAAHTVERAPTAFTILADRNAAYYWVDVTQRVAGSLSSVEGSANPLANRIELAGVTNVSALAIEAPPAVFDPASNFTLTLATSDSGSTDVTVPGVPGAPDYVYAGDGFSGAWTGSWNHAGGALTFEMPGSATTTVSPGFDAWTAVASGNPTATQGLNYTLSMQASTQQPCLLLIGFSDQGLPLSLVDPNDDRWLNMGFDVLPILLPVALDGTGHASVKVFVPTDPALNGQTLRFQFITFPGGTTIVEEISNFLEAPIVPGP